MVFLYDAFGKRQSQSPTTFLCGEARAKHVLYVLVFYALACILHVYHNAAGRGMCLDMYASLATHGVNSILAEVFENPLQELGVSIDSGLVLVQFGGDKHFLRCAPVHVFYHPFEQCGEVDFLALRS